MKNTKLIGALVGAVLLIGLIYLAKDKLGGGGESLNPEKASDLDVVKNENADPDMLYRSMIRLGKEQNETAKSVALARLKDPEVRVRAAAFEALGFFTDEESIKALSQGLVDEDRIVRLATIRGIARVPSQERVQMILDRLNSKDLLNQEKIELFATLSRIGTEKEVQSAVEWLVYLAGQGNGQDNTEAAFRVASIAPNDPKVVQLYKNKLKANTEPRMTAFALRHLSSIKDQSIMRELKSYANNADADIRISVVQSAAIACVPDRWEIIEGIAKKEKDPRVMQAIIRAPTMILGAKSLEFLHGLDVTDMAPDLAALLQATLDEVEKNKGNGHCESN